MDPSIFPQLVQVTLAGGFGYVVKAAWDFFATRQTAKTPEAKQAAQLTHTTGQIDLLARVNSELESDLDRMRKTLHDVEDRFYRQRDEWAKERAALLTELDEMRGKLVDLMSEVDTLQHKLRDITDRHG